MRTQLILFTIAAVIFNQNFSQAQTQNSISLSNYTVQPALKNSEIGLISVDHLKDFNLKLTGKNSDLFQLKGHKLLLSEKGAKYFLKSDRASLTLTLINKKENHLKKKFIILKNVFHCNPIIAHRGAWKNTNVPQNSIASLKAAIKLGAAGSEFDIRMTADEVLVINHDPEYYGMPIEKTKYVDLSKKFLTNGEPIPTLENYLRVGMGQQKTKLIAEIKPSLISKERSSLVAEKVIAMVNRLQAQAWMIYISFDYDILKTILKLQPFSPTQYLNGNMSAEQLKTNGIQGASYYFTIFLKDDQWIEKAHEQNRIVNAWTVNDPSIMDYLLARNIDFITTDQPEKLLEIITMAPNNKSTLLWSEEFNYIGLPDSTKWSYDVGGHGWGNNEWQYYTKSDTANAKVKNGVLQITARKEPKENKEYTSARLVTKNKVDFKYGRIDIRARLPKGRGTWPAIWMLGKSHPQTGWPLCGEIDIMEYVGFEPDSVFGTIHTQAYNHMQNTQKGKKTFIEKPYDNFHIYTLNWTPEKLEFMVDGKIYNKILNEHKTKAEWPFDDPFYLILNIAIGGNLGGKHGVDEMIFPATMEIDYIRLFKN